MLFLVCSRRDFPVAALLKMSLSFSMGGVDEKKSGSLHFLNSFAADRLRYLGFASSYLFVPVHLTLVGILPVAPRRPMRFRRALLVRGTCRRFRWSLLCTPLEVLVDDPAHEQLPVLNAYLSLHAFVRCSFDVLSRCFRLHCTTWGTGSVDVNAVEFVVISPKKYSISRVDVSSKPALFSLGCWLLVTTNIGSFSMSLLSMFGTSTLR